MKTPLTSKSGKVWRLDTDHTGLYFRVGHLGLAEVRGGFTEYEGTVETVGDLFESARIELLIKAESISTANVLRDNHLKSTDFFDVVKYPEIRFKSSNFQYLSNNKYIITGSLTIKGISKTVSFDTIFKGTTQNLLGNEVAVFVASGEINRLDYNLHWHPMLENGFPVVDEKVVLDLVVEMHRIG